ncbi:type-F conjugative transfer system pilin chaperone TraQ [Symbiopectobacterium purcellii]|uniref:type-F conjugative transfer system pilin chaperone TraQ n=1 Tax=Symbiopectobacterium purcellii TaxID=2871826 RepID=UPI003F86470A
MRKFRFRLPEFDNVGLWILTLGVWFYIVSRLIRPNPSMAILLAQIIGLSLSLWGVYRILNVWIARARAAEKDAVDRRTSTGAEHHEG